MSKLEDLVERVDRLVLRHGELRRSTALVEQQLAAMTAERDNLRLRLATARSRVNLLLQRLPPEGVEPSASGSPGSNGDKDSSDKEAGV